MLLHAHHYLRPGSYVYLVLPLACVTNSRYLTHEHLRAILHSTGYSLKRNEYSARLTRWLLQTREPRPVPKHKQIYASQTPLSHNVTALCNKAKQKYWDNQVFKKKELVAGANRNNFCIIVTVVHMRRVDR